MNVTDCNIHSIMRAAKCVTKYMLTLISILQSATGRLELSKIHQCENILNCRVGPPYRVWCLDTVICGRMDITELTGETRRPKGTNVLVCCSEIP
jgi:hypothetical protein